MSIQTKIHDGIIAALFLLSILLAFQVSIEWLWLGVAVGLVMLSSTVTGFCPIHYTIGKALPPSK